MGFWSRLLGRQRGVLSQNMRDDDRQPEEEVRLPRPQPTPSMRRIETPPPTPSTRPLEKQGSTRGTPSYGDQGGTPSTQRIHNPSRPGR